MPSPFTSLLDLRREAEQRAVRAVDRAVAVRAAEEAEQNRLAARWRKALTARDGEGERRAAPAATAAQALTRERYRAGLQADVTVAARRAAEHRVGALAAALRAEAEARAALEQAHAAVAAVERLLAREQAEAARLEHRRAEDSASDLANAAFVRERRR